MRSLRSWWRRPWVAGSLVAVACAGSFLAGNAADSRQDHRPLQTPIVKVVPKQRALSWSKRMESKVDVRLAELSGVNPLSTPSQAVLEEASSVGYRIGEEVKRSAAELSERTVNASGSKLSFEHVFEKIREAYCLLFAWLVENDKDPTSQELIGGIVGVLPEGVSRDVVMLPSDAADFARGLSEAKTNGEVAVVVANAVLCR